MTNQLTNRPNLSVRANEEEKCQCSVIGKWEEKVRGLKCKLDESKGELEKLKVQIGGVDGCKSEVTFIFELKGVEALFTAGPKKENMSELFYCRGELELV